MDPSGRIVRWERNGTKENPLETLVFDDFREVEGISMPFHITYTGPEGVELALRYRSLLLNQAIEDRLFDISEVMETGKHE